MSKKNVSQLFHPINQNHTCGYQNMSKQLKNVTVLSETLANW